MQNPETRKGVVGPKKAKSAKGRVAWVRLERGIRSLMVWNLEALISYLDIIHTK
jgi:hypothetical protein